MNEYGPLKRVISSPLLAAAKTLAADELMGNRYCYWAVSKRWRGVVGEEGVAERGVKVYILSKPL